MNSPLVGAALKFSTFESYIKPQKNNHWAAMSGRSLSTFAGIEQDKEANTNGRGLQELASKTGRVEVAILPVGHLLAALRHPLKENICPNTDDQVFPVRVSGRFYDMTIVAEATDTFRWNQSDTARLSVSDWQGDPCLFIEVCTELLMFLPRGTKEWTGVLPNI